MLIEETKSKTTRYTIEYDELKEMLISHISTLSNRSTNGVVTIRGEVVGTKIRILVEFIDEEISLPVDK